ncbi:MAG: TFIIB-type zinc finger domain-containing protein [Enterococcus sp.]|nr:TFIIB-type zinc finger domain-containing protein [Enterococcus sp.]
MEKITCSSCGANEFKTENGKRICTYCGTVYKTQSTSTIALDNDVARLLLKCQTDPANARKYANLILDIDPTNKTAYKYL